MVQYTSTKKHLGKCGWKVSSGDGNELGEVNDGSDVDEEDEECMMDDGDSTLTHNTNIRAFKIYTYTHFMNTWNYQNLLTALAYKQEDS